MEELRQLFALHGHGLYIGEQVSQAEHMRQAAYFASQLGFSREVQIAAFLHDIGHLMGLRDPSLPQMEEWGTTNHEVLAADFCALKLGLGPEVTEPIRHHVNAKRYLVGSDECYAAKLSIASQQTLKRQGGAMGEAELLAFREHPQFKEILQLRSCDEAAKVVGMSGETLPSLEFYFALVEEERSKRRISRDGEQPTAVTERCAKEEAVEVAA